MPMEFFKLTRNHTFIIKWRGEKNPVVQRWIKINILIQEAWNGDLYYVNHSLLMHYFFFITTYYNICQMHGAFEGIVLI